MVRRDSQHNLDDREGWMDGDVVRAQVEQRCRGWVQSSGALTNLMYNIVRVHVGRSRIYSVPVENVPNDQRS